MSDRANTTFRRDTVPWWVRMAAGAVAGWLIADRFPGGGDPSWTGPAAAATLAIAFVAAPGVNPWAGSGVVSGWAVATALGLYAGVPETDQIIGVIAVLLVLWGAEPAGRARVDWLVACGLDAVLVLAAIHGAAGRPGALIAALAMLGLLVVAGPVSLLPRPSQLVPDVLQAATLLGLQFAFAFVVARKGGVRTTTSEALVVSATALVALAVAAWLVMGQPTTYPRRRR